MTETAAKKLHIKEYKESSTPSVQLVSNTPKKLINITGQTLTLDKAIMIKQELENAIQGVCEKHGLIISRLRGEMIDSGEFNLTTRLSTRNAHGFDSLTRDLLNYCGQLGILPSIMNASIVLDGAEHVISGIDISVDPYMFRLKCVTDSKSVFAKNSTIKSILPAFFKEIQTK